MNKKSERDAQVIADSRAGLLIREIADKRSLNPATVHCILKRHGEDQIANHKARFPQRQTMTDLEAKACRLRSEGKKLKDIGAECDRTATPRYDLFKGDGKHAKAN